MWKTAPDDRLRVHRSRGRRVRRALRPLVVLAALAGVGFAYAGAAGPGGWAGAPRPAGPGGWAGGPRPHHEAVANVAAWGIYDGRARRVVAGRRIDARRPVASITKLMTAYLVLQEGGLGRAVIVPSLDLVDGESAVGLVPGQRLTRARLLAALVVASAGDAAQALAVAVAGTRRAFVRRMNAAARRLGLRRTRYANPSGVDAPGARSTVRDSLRLAWLLMQDARFRALARLRTITVAGRVYPATNDLLLTTRGVDGVKTGHTASAGWNIVASAWRDGRRMYVCVLGAPDRQARDRAAATLLAHAFRRAR